MAYHDELLEHAAQLVSKHDPSAADLRRAVSAAYYALFHLLISKTVANWSHGASRDDLARMFEHRVMKAASKSVLNDKQNPFQGEDPWVVQRLRSVAESFVELQEKRHTADYDNVTQWTPTAAKRVVGITAHAVHSWNRIESQMIAQNYLVSLLIKPRQS